MSSRVLVTRPAPEAQRWADQLRAHGVKADALPLIEIGPCRTPAAQAPLAHAQQRLAHGDYRAAMFVSGNAAQYFFEQKLALAPFQQAQEAIKTRAWSPGPGTARVLQHCGVPATRIDGPASDATQFDSESLWQAVAWQVQPGDRILIVRGCSAGQEDSAQGQGRDWLREQIAQAGGHADVVVAYERGAPTWDAAQYQLAQAAAQDGSQWLLSSSEAIHHLISLLPHQDWSRARALATHPRIAQTALQEGFGEVRQCRPALEDVVASIESSA